MRSFNRGWALRIGVSAARLKRRYQFMLMLNVVWYSALILWIAIGRFILSGPTVNFVALLTLVISIAVFIPLSIVTARSGRQASRAAATALTSANDGRAVRISARTLQGFQWFDSWAQQNRIQRADSTDHG